MMREIFGAALVGAVAANIVSWQPKLNRDIHRDIQVLTELLKEVQRLLMGADAEEAGAEDEDQLRTVAAVRELCFEIEDKVDDWMLLEMHQAYYKDGIKRHVSKLCQSLRPGKIHYQTAEAIKDTKRRLMDTIDEYKRRKIEGCSSPRSKKVDPRLGMIHKDASELVGFHVPRKDLVKWLNLLPTEVGESGHQTKVASIVGCAGLGKTALAKQIYDEFGETFQYRAFVSVSKSPDMKEIFSAISSQLHIRDNSCAEIEDPAPPSISSQIRDFLRDKRYFIIIDDIWDIDTWNNLDSALCKNSLGSVIMTTTRMHDVANKCCPSSGDLVYKIQPLSVADSKMLFFKGIFGCEEKCPPDLKEASDDILKKCEGLPLAINAMSSLLSSGKTTEEWDQVRSFIDFAPGKNTDIDAMYYILSLSYWELPSHLRIFLLCLTMFPGGCQIERGRLVQRWISESFIHDAHGEDLVELGEKYLDELVNKSLIESVGMQYDAKGKFYRVHSVILDFLISRSAEANFSTLMNNPSNLYNRVHRLLLLGNEDQACVAQLDLSPTRSLGVIRHFEKISSGVKSHALCVLDLQDCAELGNHHIKDIGRHYKLRYFNISGTDISELPVNIGDLVYLETLDASFTELVEIPASITQLEKLVRLFISDETKLPDKIGNMNLEELGDINTFKQSLTFLKELGELSKLRKLGIIWDTNGISKFDKESYKEKKLESSLCKLDARNLHTLRITFYLRDKDGFIGDPFLPALKSIREVFLRHGRICWIIKWLLSLGNLEKLYVSSREEIEKEDLQRVGGILTLLEFRLYSGCLGPIIISEGFQKLERLELKFSFFSWCSKRVLCRI